MIAIHHVRNVRLRAVGSAPQGSAQSWYELDFDAEDTVGICFYPVTGSDAQKKFQAIASLLNNWPPASEPLTEQQVGDAPQSAPVE